MIQFESEQKKPSSNLINFLQTWKKLTKKDKKQYTYQPEIIFQLFNTLFHDINLSSFILPAQYILQKLINTLNNFFSFYQIKIGETIQIQKQNAVVFILRGYLKFIDKISNDKLFKKIQLIDTLAFQEKQIRRASKGLSKIQAISSRGSKIIQISNQSQKNKKNYQKEQFDTLCLIYNQKQFDNLKQDLIKSEKIIKMDFLTKYLFGGYNLNFSEKLIIVQKFKPKAQISFKTPYQKVSLLYSGLAKFKITDAEQQISFETSLLNGSLLTDPFSQELDQKKKKIIKDKIIFLNECIVLSLDYQEFKKIIKNQISIKNSIRVKQKEILNYHLNLIDSIKNAKETLKDNQEIKPVLNYPIRMKRKQSNKLFRVKINQLTDIQNFMTMDFYKKMTQNKQAVVYRKDQYEFKNMINNKIKQKSSFYVDQSFLKIQNRQNQQVQHNILEQDVTLKGFFEVGCRLKTQKLSTSIFRKQIPSNSRKPKVYTAFNKKVSKNQTILRSLMPKSATKSHQLYKEYNEFEKNIRRSQNFILTQATNTVIQKENIHTDAICIKLWNFFPQERFSLKVDQSQKENKQNSIYKTCTTTNNIKSKTNIVSSSKQTSKTNIKSQQKFIKVDAKNIINTLVSLDNSSKNLSPFITSSIISPRKVFLKKKDRSYINMKSKANIHQYP